MRRVRWTLTAVLLVLAHGLAPAWAAPAGDSGVRVEVTAGLDGRAGTGRSYPVLVEIESDRLLTGTLRLSARTEMGNDVIQRSIEVAGGTTKRYALTVGTSSGFGGDSVRVDVFADGEPVASESATVTADGTEELVGVLPGLAASLDRDTAPLAIDLGQARLGQLPAEVLAEGPLALETYDQIAAGSGDLDDLSDSEIRTLTQWVGQGGYLLLDGDQDVDALPSDYDPSPGVGRVVGFGKVVLTKGALAEGRWQDVLLPTPVQSQAEEEILGSGTFTAGDVTASLAADAGFDIPSIRTLLLVLAAYIVVVGPVAWFIVRRRRTTLLWGIVPVVALLTTGFLRVAGDELRHSDPSVHVTMIETAGGEAMATTSVFVTGGGDRSSVDLAPGWRTAINPYFGGFGFLTSGLPTVTRHGEGSSVELDARVGGAAVVRARGPVELPGSLVVTATSDTDGVMRGTVENTLDVALEEVAVFVARVGREEVGSLGPGEVREWEIDDATRFEFETGAEAAIWPLDIDESFGFEGGVPFDPNTGEPIPIGRLPDNSSMISSLSAYSDLFSDRGSTFKPQGQAVAVGWTRELDAPVRVNGRSVSDGRTGIVGRSAAASVGGRLIDTGSVQHLVRGPNAAGRMAVAEDRVGPVRDAALGVYAFDLPSEVGERRVDEDRLVLHVPGLFARIQVWAGGRWVELPAGDGEVPLPRRAVVQQTIFARAEIPIDQVPGPGRAFVVYEAEP
jgi:hypothetical protein